MEPTITVGGRGEDTPVRPPEAPRPWMLVAIALVAGLALGSIFSPGPTSDEAPAITAEASVQPAGLAAPSVSPSTTTTTEPRESVRLATLVPGLVDRLVVAGVNIHNHNNMKVWDLAEATAGPANLPFAPVDRSIPSASRGGGILRDVSGSWLGAIIPSRYTNRSMLWLGNATYMEPLTEADTFTWHAGFPGRLAYTVWRDEVTELWTFDLVGPRPSTQLVAEIPHPNASVEWWAGRRMTLTTPMPKFSTILVDDATGEVLLDETVRPIGPTSLSVGVLGNRIVNPEWDDVTTRPWQDACESGASNGSTSGTVRFLVICRTTDVQAVQVWTWDGAEMDLTMSVALDNATSPGWTTNGAMAYVVVNDAFRPSATIHFLDIANNEVIELDYPGRIVSLVAVAG